MCHEIFFSLHFIMIWTRIGAPDKRAELFSNSFSILRRYSIKKLVNSFSAVCMTPQSQNFSLSEPPLFRIQIYWPMTAVFTNKNILSDYPFQNNQRQPKCFILTPQCNAHRCVCVCVCECVFNSVVCVVNIYKNCQLMKGVI